MKKLSILFFSVLLSSNVFSNEKNIAERSFGISENSSLVGTNQVGIFNNHVDGKKIYIEGIIESATASHGIFSLEVKITKGELIGKTIKIYLTTGSSESEEELRFTCGSFKLDSEMEACGEILDGIYGQIVSGLIFEKKSKFDDYTGDSPYNWQTVFRPFELHLKRK